MPHRFISPQETLSWLYSSEASAEPSVPCAFIDVRSENEWNQGGLPGFVNEPILKNEERHQVGLTYKFQGQTAAIEAGIALTREHKERRISRWAEMISSRSAKSAVISCWRGGLRSKIAVQWLLERFPALEIYQVSGGYKALRRELRNSFSAKPAFLVISGMTGTGKTHLLNRSRNRIDLEALALHRGSAFGKIPGMFQPSQSTFENQFLYELYRFQKSGCPEILVEDESNTIGKIQLPKEIKDRIRCAPVIVVEESVETRARSIAKDYIADSIRSGISPEDLRLQFVDALSRISEKLGGLQAARLRDLVNEAFAVQPEFVERHLLWISDLLVNYYDQMYEYSFSRLDRPVLFRGNWKECAEWIVRRHSALRIGPPDR